MALTDDQSPAYLPGLVPDRGRFDHRFAADHRVGADRRRGRMARAQPRRVRAVGAVLLGRATTRICHHGVAPRARWRRREARGPGEGRSDIGRGHGCSDDPDGAGVPEFDVRRLRLPRGIDRHGPRARAGGRRHGPRAVRDNARSEGETPGDGYDLVIDVRLPARHGRPGRRGQPRSRRCSRPTGRG